MLAHQRRAARDRHSNSIRANSPDSGVQIPTAAATKLHHTDRPQRPSVRSRARRTRGRPAIERVRTRQARPSRCCGARASQRRQTSDQGSIPPCGRRCYPQTADGIFNLWRQAPVPVPAPRPTESIVSSDPWNHGPENCAAGFQRTAGPPAILRAETRASPTAGWSRCPVGCVPDATGWRSRVVDVPPRGASFASEPAAKVRAIRRVPPRSRPQWPTNRCGATAAQRRKDRGRLPPDPRRAASPPTGAPLHLDRRRLIVRGERLRPVARQKPWPDRRRGDASGRPNVRLRGNGLCRQPSVALVVRCGVTSRSICEGSRDESLERTKAVIL